MPIKRRTAKRKPYTLTLEVFAAYQASDYVALHRALGLKPWEASPLPQSITPLGASDDPAADGPEDLLWAASCGRAREIRSEIQRALKALSRHAIQH